MSVCRWSIMLLLTTWATAARAHELRPAYLEIVESEPDTYDVLWKVPARGETQRLSLHVRFDEDVQFVGTRSNDFIADAHLQRSRVRRAGGLAGTSITIDGLVGTYTDVLVRLELADGTEFVSRLTPDAPTYVVETRPSLARIGWVYFVLGVEHILLGIDHLLFVLALLFVVDGWKKLIGTITAFTVAHTITLILATLDVVRVPIAPVEAVIALSIVFVAAEIIRGRQGHPGLTARRPWIVAFTFGLLHGFGFAGALGEVGLPQSSIPIALLTFNLGVEAGQLIFVAAALGVYALLRRVPFSPPEWLCRAPAYAIGGIAAFWMIERTAGFWGS